MAKKKVPAKAPTKTEILNSISETTELTKKDVAAVLDALSEQIEKSLAKRGPGMFTIPGLCKIVVQHKPAQPAKKNVPNPFKPGEFMDRPAKPARRVVKVRPLKALKDMAE